MSSSIEVVDFKTPLTGEKECVCAKGRNFISKTKRGNVNGHSKVSIKNDLLYDSSNKNLI